MQFDVLWTTLGCANYTSQVLNRALLLEKSPRALAARAAARRALLQREEAWVC